MTDGPGPRLSVVIATHDNLPVLTRCLNAWRRYALDRPVELLVVEDGCTDDTPAYLRSVATEAWGTMTMRALHEDNVHELMCTNRGFREARAPLILSWHDDMFVQASWFVPEVLRTFDAYPDIGLLSLSRGLRCHPLDEPIRTFDDSVDWRRLESTIGNGPFNWLRLTEVDAVMRPWAVRRACIDRVGPLDEVFRPTEWDEADFCFRIRAAGWKVATHGFERGGAYEHLLSTTYGRTPSERRQAAALRNAMVFHERWDPAIADRHGRVLQHWRRRMSVAGMTGTLLAAARTATRPGGGAPRERA
ncbi:MAG: glycosyltransferase family 2 protein [Gemmatimonadaceae bacterium]